MKMFHILMGNVMRMILRNNIHLTNIDVIPNEKLTCYLHLVYFLFEKSPSKCWNMSYCRSHTWLHRAISQNVYMLFPKYRKINSQKTTEKLISSLCYIHLNRTYMIPQTKWNSNRNSTPAIDFNNAKNKNFLPFRLKKMCKDEEWLPFRVYFEL